MNSTEDTMSPVTVAPPDFAIEAVAAVVAEKYHLQGEYTQLVSERDQNFLLRTVEPGIDDVCGRKVVACRRLAKQLVLALTDDYFVRHRRDPARQRRRRPLLWAALTVGKNAVGAALILAGLAMLVLPGQGLLTILMGLALTNFPGKFAVERRLVRLSSVARALNRVREVAGRPPLEYPPKEAG